MNSPALRCPSALRLWLPAACLSLWPGISSPAGAAPPRLSITGPSGPMITVSWTGEPGISYQLQTATTLGGWADVGSAITGMGLTIRVPVNIAGKPRAFFRLKPPPPDIITAVFVPGSGILTVTGGDQDNTILLSRDAAGALLVNGGAVTITGGIPTVANTARIDISGREGDDDLRLDEAQGALPPARLFGEDGHDILTGGSGADVLDGGPGNDILSGKGGSDSLTGGDGQDSLTGGDGGDQVSGGNGDDRLIWHPGDDTDLHEGDSGQDTVEINGGNGAENFSIAANTTRVRFDRLDPAPFSIDIGSAENLILHANGGNDGLACTGNLAALISITADGGAGEDSLSGSNGPDILIGGADNDFLDGQQGNDILFLGAGDDTAQWDPGDGNDIIEGQDGSDTLRFNGSNAGETMAISANGTRILLTRNIGNITLDLADIETADLRLLGSADTLTVNDTGGTGLFNIVASLAATPGGGTGDSAADSIILNGTAAPDAFSLTAGAPHVTATTPSATVHILNPEAAHDRITLNGLGGTDSFSTGAGVSVLIGVTINQ